MAGIDDDLATDYYYQDDLYLENPDEKFSCPICLCPVQRQAYLTECCGRHFCLKCIGRLRNERKPCPMGCNAASLVIFPNKERQREIKQIRVRCPLSLAQYQGVSGRGHEATSGTTPSKNDSGGQADTLSEEKESEITEECCIENQGGFSNARGASEVTTLSMIVDKLTLNDNVHSGEDQTSSKVGSVNESKSTEDVKSTESVDRAKSDTCTPATVCDWTGELGKVESHVSEVHGAEALRRIKHDDDDIVQSAAHAQQVHDHHHHHHSHSNIRIHHPRNVTYHCIRTQGGRNEHYHVHNSPPFNVSNAVSTSNDNIIDGNLYPANQPSVVHVRVNSQQAVTTRLAQQPQLFSPEERVGLSAAANVPNQAFSVSSASGMGDGQERSGQQPQSAGNLNQDRSSTPNSCSSLEPNIGRPVQSHQAQPDNSSASEREQQSCASRNQSSSAAVVVSQPSSLESPSGQFVFQQPGGNPGQPRVQFIRPLRGWPHRYHMRGMRGHHHHHHHGGHGPHFRHHPPPHHAEFPPPGPPHPPPPHGPHGPHHPPPPPRGFPPGPGRGGHPHHHRHHPHDRRHGCHGHHHHPPPH